MAKILNKEPAVYKKEQDNFLRELRKFHDSKGWVKGSGSCRIVLDQLRVPGVVLSSLASSRRARDLIQCPVLVHILLLQKWRHSCLNYLNSSWSKFMQLSVHKLRFSFQLFWETLNNESINIGSNNRPDITSAGNIWESPLKIILNSWWMICFQDQLQIDTLHQWTRNRLVSALLAGHCSGGMGEGE